MYISILLQDHNSLHVSSVYVIPQHSVSYTKALCLLLFYNHRYFTILTVNLTRIMSFLNCWLILTFSNGNCILVLTTLKMATLVAETFQRKKVVTMY